eukprot:m51a1_g5551 hypothetical protein (346) ;mRNA; f:539861-541295
MVNLLLQKYSCPVLQDIYFLKPSNDLKSAGDFFHWELERVMDLKKPAAVLVFDTPEIDDSFYTSVELVALCAANVLFPGRISYSAYFMVKTLLSLGVFRMRLATVLARRGKPSTAIRYALGFGGEPHAGLWVGDQFVHYAFPRSAPGDPQPPLDRSFGLAPQIESSPPKRFAWIDVAVGFAFTADLRDCRVLEVLYASGKCHDWAVVAAYVLSVDKWLTASVLLWARWLSWIALLMGMVLLPSAATGLPQALMELFMVATALLDSLNLRKEQLEANARLESEVFGKSFWYSLKFFLLLVAACTSYALYVPAWFCSFEFPASIALSAICCKYVDSLITSAVLRASY